MISFGFSFLLPDSGMEWGFMFLFFRGDLADDDFLFRFFPLAVCYLLLFQGCVFLFFLFSHGDLGGGYSLFFYFRLSSFLFIFV